jgi:transposase-like protein
MAAPITTSYSKEEKTQLIRMICGLIIQSSVENACKQAGINDSTFYAWLAADEELADEYARARKAIAYKDEAEIEAIVKRASEGDMPSDVARVVIDARKWLAGKRNPKVYGDNQKVELTGRVVTVVVGSNEDKDLLDKL